MKKLRDRGSGLFLSTSAQSFSSYTKHTGKGELKLTKYA